MYTNSYEIFELAYQTLQINHPELCAHHEQVWQDIATEKTCLSNLRDFRSIKARYQSPSDYIKYSMETREALHPVISLPAVMGQIPADNDALSLMFKTVSVLDEDVDDEFAGLNNREIIGKLFHEYLLDEKEPFSDIKDYSYAVDFISYYKDALGLNIKPETLIRYRNLWLQKADKTLD